jgi:hypothetical protein
MRNHSFQFVDLPGTVCPISQRISYRSWERTMEDPLPLLMRFALATLCICFALFAVSVFVLTAKNAKIAQRNRKGMQVKSSKLH